MLAKMKPRPDEIVAQTLSFLAAEPERMQGFFAATGINADSLRQVVDHRVFKEVLLDYVLDSPRLLEDAERQEGLTARLLGHTRLMLDCPPEPRRAARQGSARHVEGQSSMARRFALVEGGRS